MAISKEVAVKILVDIYELENQHKAELNQFNENEKLILRQWEWC